MVERSKVRPHRAYFRSERAKYRTGTADLLIALILPERADFGPKIAEQFLVQLYDHL